MENVEKEVIIVGGHIKLDTMVKFPTGIISLKRTEKKFYNIVKRHRIKSVNSEMSLSMFHH